MHWFFRRRIKLVLHQVGARLNIELPSFKLTRRQVLIDRLFHDHKVQAAAAAHATASDETLGEVWRRVDRYAREIVPSFNAYVYYRIGYALARAAARALYRVRIGFVDEQGLARIDPKSTIVFVINHRSNMDYVLVAFLAAERATLSFAVGEWARIWPLQQLIRAMGAYFVRRNSGDPLYRTVLSRYVQMASEAGVTQAVFPEGGLTVDGRLRPPKFGLLDYMLKTFDEREDDGRRDLVFIPVGLNYDRVLEDRSQLLKLHPEAPRPGRLRGLIITSGFFLRNLSQLATGGYRALAELKAHGLIRAIGAGINETGMIPRFLDLFDLDFFLVALRYTLMEHDSAQDQHAQADSEGVVLVVARDVDMRSAGLEFAHESMGRCLQFQFAQGARWVARQDAGDQ